MSVVEEWMGEWERQNDECRGSVGSNNWVTPLISDASCPHQIPAPYSITPYYHSISHRISRYTVPITKQTVLSILRKASWPSNLGPWRSNGPRGWLPTEMSPANNDIKRSLSMKTQIDWNRHRLLSRSYCLFGRP